MRQRINVELDMDKIRRRKRGMENIMNLYSIVIDVDDDDSTVITIKNVTLPIKN